MTFGSSFSKKVHCIHILWCIFMGLGHNDPWVESQMWPQQMWGQRSSRGQWPLVQVFWQKRSLYPHTLMYFHGTWTQCENTSKYVDTVNLFAKTWTKGHWPLDDVWPHICWGHMCDSTQGSLCPSPNPWVESHMWPQQMWGQRSSRGQWPLVQVFAKTVTVSTYFDVCSGETRGSRTTCCLSFYLKVDDMLLLCSLNPEQRSLVWPQTDNLSGFKKLSVLFSNFSGCTNNHLLWLAPTSTPPFEYQGSGWKFWLP